VPSNVRGAGSRAVLVECGAWQAALRLARRLLEHPLDGQEDVVQGEASVLVLFADDRSALLARSALPGLTAAGPGPEAARKVRIDVVYDGPDLEEIGELTGLGAAGVIRLHAETTWTVAFVGFAPGFAYLVAPHDRLRVARRTDPRTRVPAGSVAVGGAYSAVYPRESPGGWQLIGRSPTVMWDLANDPPSTLGPGDQVQFTPVREAAFLTSPAAGSAEEGTGTARSEAQAGAAQAGPHTAAAEPGEPGASGAMTGPALVTEQPGFQATIQDAGRGGLGHLGIGRSGALDAGALAEANRLVGNPAGAAGIELAPGGFACRAAGEVILAVTGAAADLTIDQPGPDGDQRPAPFRTPFLLRSGERLSFGLPHRGFRSYLAVRGGVAVDPVLGSRSTDTLSSLGPPPLRAGTVIPVGSETAGEVWYSASEPAVAEREGAAPADRDGTAPGETRPTVLPVVLGPRDDLFSAAAVEKFLASTWTVGTAADRVGLRLAGSAGALPTADTAELPSEGMAAGSVQVPPSGNPILFVNDHPLTGGYPVIGVVEPDALRATAQLAPGDRIVFQLARPGGSAPGVVRASANEVASA
jgi:KipI family sensor histidine kinase inhibitor